MRVVCAQRPEALDPAIGVAFSLFTAPDSPEIGRVGSSIPLMVRRAWLSADPLAWDFLSLALAVVAADQGCLRTRSPDGWTRQIELTVAVCTPNLWAPHSQAIAQALGFLTGDVWTITFDGGGMPPPIPAKRTTRSRAAPSGDMVCLLSGGADSLVGAIDLVAQGRKPVFVSQVSSGDSDRQCRFAAAVDANLTHLQFSHAVRPPGAAERSQRARSVGFLAYGLLAATALPGHSSSPPIDLVVPENGFISMNVPLTASRIGSLSTRTTHPYFLSQIQRLWDALGFRVTLRNPYQFKTKGEMLEACQNQKLLRKLVFESTSCGRFGRYGYKHCGRCVPCLVRRGAFLRWGRGDETAYQYESLATQRAFDDVRSAAMACALVRREGVERWASGAISFAELGDARPYQETVERGLDELRALLTAEGAA